MIGVGDSLTACLFFSVCAHGGAVAWVLADRLYPNARERGGLWTFLSVYAVSAWGAWLFADGRAVAASLFLAAAGTAAARRWLAGFTPAGRMAVVTLVQGAIVAALGATWFLATASLSDV